MSVFHSPWFALLFLPLLVVAWRARHVSAGVAVSDLRLLQPTQSPWRRALARFPKALVLTGLAAVVIALMRPREGIERTVDHTEGIDIVLLLDVSGSMRAFDADTARPDLEQMMTAIRDGNVLSRINVAKTAIAAFVAKRSNDRFGLVVFARDPYVVCPPTVDHAFLLERLHDVEAGELPDGTGLAAALGAAVNRLQDSPALRKVAVMVTDGANNVDDIVSPEDAGRIAAQFNVVVYTIGVGSGNAWMWENPRLQRRLQRVPSSFDETLLRQLADVTGGRHLAAHDPAGFKAAMRELDVLEKTRIEMPRYVEYRERFMPFLVGGIVLITIGFVLGNTWLQSLP